MQVTKVLDIAKCQERGEGLVQVALVEPEAGKIGFRNMYEHFRYSLWYTTCFLSRSVWVK